MERRRDIDDDDNNDNGGGGGGEAERAVGALDSSGEEGPSPTVIEVHVDNFEPGLRLLEAACAAQGTADAPLREVALVSHNIYFGIFGNTDEFVRQSLRRSYARFVALLEQCGREKGGVRAVRFEGIRVGGRPDDPFDLFDAGDHECLFGEVLPSLPNLKRVRFYLCVCPEIQLTTFASRLSATSSLVELDVNNCYCDVRVCGPAIAAMIRRSVPLQVLKMNGAYLMDRDDYRQIFESLQHNTNLRSLEVVVRQVHGDALILPTNKSSALRSLRIDVTYWTDEGKASLAAQLKTNTVLEDLHVVRGGAVHVDHRPWVEMLESHNFTLRSLREDSNVVADMNDERVLALLRRNRRIREALGQLKTYRVSRAALWPRVLGMVSTLPTLLYRFVRLGENSEVCALLVARQRQQWQRQRSGSPTNNNSNKRSRPNPPP